MCVVRVRVGVRVKVRIRVLRACVTVQSVCDGA